MSLTSWLSAEIRARYVKPYDQADGTFHPVIGGTTALTSGTGANQADVLWCDTRTLAKASAEALDLAGGLTDAFGTVLTMARVKGLLVAADAANTSAISVKSVVTGPATGFSSWLVADGDGVSVRPGGTLLLVAPDATAYAVTAGTGDLLTVANPDADNAATYTIALIGCTV